MRSGWVMRTPATDAASERVPATGSLALATLARVRGEAAPGRGRVEDEARVCERDNSYSNGECWAAATAEMQQWNANINVPTNVPSAFQLFSPMYINLVNSDTSPNANINAKSIVTSIGACDGSQIKVDVFAWSSLQAWSLTCHAPPHSRRAWIRQSSSLGTRRAQAR